MALISTENTKIKYKPKEKNQRFKKSITTNLKNSSTNPTKITNLQTQITKNRETELESLNLREREIIIDLN